MIEADYIRTIAASAKLGPGTVEKDYVLSKTIMALAQIEEFQSNLVFKGGTALKKCYFPTWRFSEDLDFTSRNELSTDEINQLFKIAVNMVESLFGMTMRVIEYSQYPRQGMPIASAQLKLGYDGPLRKTSGLKNNIRVDIALNERLSSTLPKKSLIKQYPDDIDAVVYVYSLEEIIAEKLRSILQRGKSRDYYDVWILLRDYWEDFSAKLMVEIMRKKCQDKGIPAPRVDDFFQPERIDEASRYWERGLAHQMSNLTSFGIVINDLKGILNDLI